MTKKSVSLGKQWNYMVTMVEMHKYPRLEYLCVNVHTNSLSKYSLIIKQSKGDIILNVSTCRCCSYRWTRKIKQNIDLKAVERLHQ